MRKEGRDMAEFKFGYKMTCRILLKVCQFVKKREETPMYSFEAR